MENRYQQLDSLRGIAALAVVMAHAICITTEIPKILDYSPLHFFWASHEAVIFFFVLSGFVLSLPFFSGRTTTYWEYIIKRICRIYIPYLVAIIATFTLCYFFSRGGIDDLGKWFIVKWSKDVNVKDIVDHVLLLGNYQTSIYNPVIWSLIHEMRISIIFPLLILLIKKYPPKVIITICLIFSVIGGLNSTFVLQAAEGWRNSYFDTLHFASMFLIGALLAKNLPVISEWYKKVSSSNRTILLVTAFFAYTYSRSVKILPVEFMDVIADLGTTVGASLFIIASLHSKKISDFLSGRFFVMSGKISYSLYLFHTTVLFTIFHQFYGKLDIWVIYAISLPLVFIVSVLSWHLVELPSIQLGKSLGKRIRKPQITLDRAS